MNTYKLGALKRFRNDCFQTNEIEFESEAPFKQAALSLVSERKDFQDRFLYCPETLSPITFDFTYYFLAPTGNKVPVDRFSMTFNDMIQTLDEVCAKPETCEGVIHPFVRTLYSNAGKLGEFLNRHANTNIDLEMDNKEASIFFGPHFKDLEKATLTNNRATS